MCVRGSLPGNTGHCTRVGSMLAHRQRRWPNIKPTPVNVPCVLGYWLLLITSVCHGQRYKSGAHEHPPDTILTTGGENSRQWQKQQAAQQQKCPHSFTFSRLRRIRPTGTECPHIANIAAMPGQYTA